MAAVVSDRRATVKDCNGGVHDGVNDGEQIVACVLVATWRTENTKGDSDVTDVVVKTGEGW